MPTITDSPALMAIGAANASFVDEDYDAAIHGYGIALQADPNNADAFSKRAAAQLKLKRYTEAASDATAAIKLQATPKAYSRKGQASFALGEFEAARGAFAKAIDMLQGTKGKVELERWVRKCDAEIALESAPADEPVDISAAAVVNPMAPPPAAATSSTAAPLDPKRIRHEWYQTLTHVIVSVMAKNTPKEKVGVSFDVDTVDVSIKLESSAEYQLSLSLFHKVVPDECSYSVGTAKVEIKLKKQIPGKWESLEGSGEEAVQTMNAPPPPASSTAVADPDAAPSSKVYSGSSKNWNAIESDLKKAEEEEKPEGEEALNKLFRDIYGRADEDTRRAMNKSFQTSGGTVLSTNWGEIKEKDYDKEKADGTLKPPDGQEWKKWG